MPRKIRALVKELRDAGFQEVGKAARDHIANSRTTDIRVP
jgi:hypothetical protein